MTKNATDLAKVRLLFNPSLAGMIEKVYKNRNAIYNDTTIPFEDQIYDYYSSESDSGELLIQKRLDLFLQEIIKLDKAIKKLAVGKNYRGVYAQVNPQWAKKNAMSEKIDFASWKAVDKSQLWVAFYHFNLVADLHSITSYPSYNSKDAPIDGEKRIYIHAKSPVEKHGIDIAKFLIKQFKNNYGFSYFKMVGPGGSNRFDTIVCYCDNAYAARILIGNISENHKLHNSFAAGTSPGVKELSLCPGVGYADDKGTSYGILLSRCVAAGLKKLQIEEKSPNLTDDHLQCFFFENVEVSLKQNSINPLSPYLIHRN